MSSLTFFRRFLETPLITGSVIPSSPWLAKTLLQHCGQTDTVLELGPGTGPVTKQLVHRLQQPNQLIAIEIDPHFVKLLQKRFPSIQLYQEDINAFFDRTPDCFPTIISGIPFAAMPKSVRSQVFRQIHTHLAPGGCFSMFQYSITTLKELKNLFGEEHVKVEFVPLNIPPAFVFHCHK